MNFKVWGIADVKKKDFVFFFLSEFTELTTELMRHPCNSKFELRYYSESLYNNMQFDLYILRILL